MLNCRTGFDPYEAQVVVSPQGAARMDASLVLSGSKDSHTISGRGTPSSADAKPAAPVRIRVGGNVQTPKPLVTPPPIYPAALQQGGIHGSVMRAIIDTTGQVFHPRVDQS